MKRNNFKLTIIVLAFSLCVGLAVLSFGATDNDPLVTLSYINETVIPKITEDVKNAVLAIITPNLQEKEDDTDDLKNNEEQQPAQAIPEQQDLSTLKYKVIYLEKGQKLFASGESTESTEIILRSGEVLCISQSSSQGIADLTASKEIYNNEPLVKNNYCLIPRGGDGRGIYAANGDAYILVRGEYEIVQE